MLPTVVARNNSETERDINWGGSHSKQLVGVVMLLVTITGTLLQVKYQSQESSPFDTNKMIMESFVVVIYVYATMFVAQIIARAEGASFGKMFGDMSFFCGALASILLVLVLLPAFGWFLLTLWGVSASVWFLQTCVIPFLRRKFAAFDFHALWVKLSRIKSLDQQQQQQELPV